MRVLICYDMTSRFTNGVNVGIGQLIDGLDSLGYEVAFASDAPNRYTTRGRHYPVPWPHDEESTRQLRAAVADFKPDVIHQMVLSIRVVSVVHRLAGDVPHVVNVHSVVPRERSYGRFYGSRLHYLARGLKYLPNHILWRLTLSRMPRATMLVHSETMKKQLVSLGVRRDQVEVAHFGVSVVHQTPTAPVLARSKPQLGTVAALIHTKGIHDAIDALAGVRRCGVDASYTVVGHVRDSEYQHFLSRRIATLGLERNVRLWTDASDREKLQLLSDLDLYLQPSHEEGFCIAFLEGTYLCRRAMGTQTGAMAAIANGSRGCEIVPTGRPDVLARRAMCLLQAAVDDVELLQRQDRLRESFSWQRFVQRHGEIYQRAIRRASKRRHARDDGVRDEIDRLAIF